MPSWLQKEQHYLETHRLTGKEVCTWGTCRAPVRVVPAIDHPGYALRACTQAHVQATISTGTPPITPEEKYSDQEILSPEQQESLRLWESLKSAAPSATDPDPLVPVPVPVPSGAPLPVAPPTPPQSRQDATRTPRIIDRGTLPGGRIPNGAVYIGRGGDASRGQHPWLCPFRLRTGTPSERAQVAIKCRDYVESRLKQEPDWLAPLRGRDLVCYGDTGWAMLLLECANAKS